VDGDTIESAAIGWGNPDRRGGRGVGPPANWKSRCAEERKARSRRARFSFPRVQGFPVIALTMWSMTMWRTRARGYVAEMRRVISPCLVEAGMVPPITARGASRGAGER